MKTNLIHHPFALIAIILSIALMRPTQAEFLYNSYLTPGWEGNPDTEFSRWDIFYAPNFAPNYPDSFAPNGDYQSASEAGFPEPFPGAWSPSNPSAFWDVNNPTITQTNAGHFIIGPGFTGNIYSFALPSVYELSDVPSYNPGTVVFQFQTEGTNVDFSSIRLVYDNGAGPQELAPDEYIREYQGGSSAFGGFGNRNALQWDLTGLGVTDYQIQWYSLGSSMSFQQALLDTAAVYEAVVPEARTWTGVGNQLWSVNANWAEGTSSVENGNVRFQRAHLRKLQKSVP